VYNIRIIFAAHSNKITNRKMKKITFALAACAALTFAACGNNATEETTIDSTAIDTTVVEETVEADTTATDTAATTTEAPATAE
jgi:ABC-type oligopeptide transport system substrate-binding subunit